MLTDAKLLQLEKIDPHIGVLKFTKEGLQSLGQIFVFFARAHPNEPIIQGQGIATAESSIGLKSIVSPVTGMILSVNHGAMERPDEFTEDTVLFEIYLS